MTPVCSVSAGALTAGSRRAGRTEPGGRGPGSRCPGDRRAGCRLPGTRRRPGSFRWPGECPAGRRAARPGPLARAAGPGVAPGAVLPSRLGRLVRRGLRAAAVSVVLPVRGRDHHLGGRGRVVVGGPGGRVRRGVAVRAGRTPAGPAGGIVPFPGRVALVPRPVRRPAVDRTALPQREGRAGQRIILGAARPPPARPLTWLGGGPRAAGRPGRCPRRARPGSRPEAARRPWPAEPAWPTGLTGWAA